MREWLKALRISHSITAEDLSAALGMDIRSYMLTEEGKRQRSLDLMFALRLARLFGISLDLIAEMEKGA